tara:strand:+ start:2260 stop:4431 length:2172 start_codon:yes stop_codon:yes gene_type:complete
MDNEILEELKKLNQNLSNRGAFSGNTPSTGGGTGSSSFGKGLDATTGLLKDFGKQINQGGGRLSGATKSIANAFGKGESAIFKFANKGLGTVAGAIGYLEETTDVYRQLAKVGAGANASLGALRAQAGTANLSLQAFSNILGQNAQQLVALGGSADRGGAEIAKLGRGLFDTGIIDQFLNLGYSVDEATEFVVKNTALQSRQALLEDMTVERQVKNAAELAKNMQIMAKLTGKDINQMQEDTANRMRDGATQAAIRLMEMQGATNAGKIYAEANTRLQGSSESLRKLTQDAIQKNVPLSQVTAEYASVNAEAFHYIKEFRAAMKAGDEKRAMAAIDKAAAAEKAMAVSERGSQIATLGQISSVGKAQADVLEETGDIITGIQKLTKGLGTAVDSSKTQMDKFTEALKILTGEVDAVALGKAPGQEALKVINTAEKELAEVAGVATETIGKALDANENFKELFTGTSRMLEGLSETAESFITKFDNIKGSPNNNVQALESQIGEKTKTGDTITSADVELYKKMVDPLTSMSDRINAAQILKEKGIVGSNGIIVDSISTPIISADYGEFKKFLENPTQDATETGREPTIREKMLQFFKGGFAGGGYIPGGSFGIVGEEGMEAITGPANITPLARMMPEMAQSFSNQFTPLMNQIREMEKSGDLGAGEKMAEMLKQQQIEMQNPIGNKSLDNLNQTMLQLVDINRKTAEAVKGHFNLAQGAGKGIL